MAYRPRYDKGLWKALCDVCGREFKSSEQSKRWDGLMVCRQDFEIRHPQDFVRGVPDLQIVPWIRDEPTDTYLAICSIRDKYPLASVGTAGCCVCGDASEDSAIASIAIASFAVTGKLQTRTTSYPYL